MRTAGSSPALDDVWEPLQSERVRCVMFDVGLRGLWGLCGRKQRALPLSLLNQAFAS